MNSASKRFAVAVPIVVLWAIQAAPVAAQHSDVEFAGENGRIVIENGPTFEAEFGEGLFPAYRGDDPGFEADDGNLPAFETITFRANPIGGIGTGSRNFWYWDGTTTDGSGNPIFGAPPTDHNLLISNLVTGENNLDDGGGLLDGSNSFVNGFDVFQADSDGGIHEHMTWDIVDGTGVPGSIPVPDDGVYVFSLALLGDTLDISDGIFLVQGSGVDEDVLEAGVDFVADNAFVTPEPQSIAVWILLGIGGALALTIWRRRHSPTSTHSEMR